MEKRNIEIDLETAKEWYKKGGDWKELALSVFEEDELADERKPSLEEIRKKFEEKYPIGSIVYSNDEFDMFPHIIKSKPYILKIPNMSHCDYLEIAFDTKHIHLDKVYDSSISIYSTKEFQRVEIIPNFVKRSSVFDYNTFKEDKINNFNKNITSYKRTIEQHQNAIDDLSKYIKEDEFFVEHFDEVFNDRVNEAMAEIKKED